MAEGVGMPTDLLAEGFHELVMLVQVRGRPAARQHRHEAVIGFRRVGAPIDQPEAPEHPQVVRIDHQRHLAKDAEIQCRGGNLPADSRQAFEPDEGMLDRQAAEMVERQPAGRRGDGLQRSFEPRRLYVRISHFGDDSAKLGDRGVARRLPTAVAHDQSFESGLGYLPTGACAENPQDELTHRIEQQPRALRAETLPQPPVDFRQDP